MVDFAALGYRRSTRFRENEHQLRGRLWLKDKHSGSFLNALRKEKVPVSIYLVNGIKLQGQLESFDQFVVMLKNTVTQMVFKHAISTIVPARNVRVNQGPGGEDAHSESSEDDSDEAS